MQVSNVFFQINKVFLSFFYFKRFPFDLHNPFGYLIAFVIEYIMLGYEFFIVACSLELGIGANIFAISIIEEIRRILHSMNRKAHLKKNKSNKLKTLFLEYIHAHAAIKQLSIL